MPAPIVTLAAAHAVTDDIWIDALLNVDAPVFGFSHIAVGYGQRWRSPESWGTGAPDLNLDVKLHYFTDLQEHRFFPELSLVMGHGDGKILPYWGMDLFVDPTQLIRGDGLRFSMIGGLDWRVGERFSLQFEGRWVAFNYDASGLAVDYVALGTAGGAGVLLGMSWDVGAD